jgi:AraC-like DNA-binding protein
MDDMQELKANMSFHASDGSFSFGHSRDEVPDPNQYPLHYENGYEIYMFISGRGTFNIEGSRYELEPHSLLMMNSHELHALQLSAGYPYERCVLTFTKDFLPPFLSRGVDFVRSIKYRKLGQGNQILADTVRASGLLGLFTKLGRQLETQNAESEFIARCLIVEVLATINEIKEAELLPAPVVKPDGGKISAILDYINANLHEPLGLEALAEQFYLTKYHLCHIFKEATGYTINQYVTIKRIHLADRLMLEDYTPTQACFMAGFNSYSNFYKAYNKLTGRSPRSSRKM